MAKRDEKSKDDAEEFAFPEFDVAEFARKEEVGTKATAIVLLVGALLGVFSLAFTKLGGTSAFPGGVLLLFLGWASMRPILLSFGTNRADLDGRTLAGLGFWMFTAWLSAWIVVINTMG